MIRVHETQLGGMGEALGLEHFEDEMVVHLRGFVPRFSEILGDVGLRRCIRFGIERARVYGVTNPGLLRFYVELMFMYGGMFDTDPFVPWAGPILRDPGIPDEATRMNRLYDAMLWYLDTIGGPERSFATQALRNLQKVRFKDMPVAELRACERKAMDALVEIYPQRCAYLGEPLLRQLLRRGAEEAARHEVGTDRGIVLLTGMMFAMGHGAAEDPLLPWVSTTLRDPAIKDPEQRAARLERRTQIYLDKAVEHLDRGLDNVLQQ
ncbi:uncharacterized protein SOCE26_056950 [Sorangium cellulosum]|uniref:Uncharacterized protein n=1 Tax=Sorangium cellulosum TaxID=56 RepID=A0A2L0EY39_SORCE|nr:hypothetical protein [Sorangium cellulosum]AUX44231.1 uncharacterized protein SOCE26_056950 [Sorangium cellulosum]